MSNLEEDISRQRQIVNIKIEKKSKTGIPYAFITFKNAADADSAIKEKDGYTFGGEQLCVEPSKKNNSSLTRVYVNNLPLDVSKEAIEELFNGITVDTKDDESLNTYRKAVFSYGVFLQSGLHVGDEGKANNPNHTMIVYTKENPLDEECIVGMEKSGDGKHAEDKMIDYLEKSDEESKKVYVYLNNSPCHRCSDRLMSFSKENSIHFDIHFVGLYRCERKSCKNTKCCNLEDPANEMAVCKLNRHGQFTMSTFDLDTWNCLKLLISKFYKKQDDYTQADDKKIWQGVENTYKDELNKRVKEDQNMKSDFEHLLNKYKDKPMYDSTSDKEEPEGHSDNKKGGGSVSSKQKADEKKGDKQYDDTDKRFNEKQQTSKDQGKQSIYQINDDPSYGYESDSSFDSWIWDKINAYEASEEFKNIDKNFTEPIQPDSVTSKRNHEVTKETEQWCREQSRSHLLERDTLSKQNNNPEMLSGANATVEDVDNTGTVQVQCVVLNKTSKEFRNIGTNFTKPIQPNSMTSTTQKKHEVTKESYCKQQNDYAPADDEKYWQEVDNAHRGELGDRRKEDQNMKRNFDHLLNKHKDKLMSDSTSDKEDPEEGHSDNKKGGGSVSSKEKADEKKGDNHYDDTDEIFNEKKQISKHEGKQSIYQISDDPSSGDESDSSFDFWIWDKIIAYEASEEFKNIDKNFTEPIQPKSVTGKRKHEVTKETEQWCREQSRSHLIERICCGALETIQACPEKNMVNCWKHGQLKAPQKQAKELSPKASRIYEVSS